MPKTFWTSRYIIKVECNIYLMGFLTQRNSFYICIWRTTPFKDESKRNHEGSGKQHTVGNKDPQIHSIFWYKFV